MMQQLIEQLKINRIRVKKQSQNILLNAINQSLPSAQIQELVQKCSAPAYHSKLAQLLKSFIDKKQQRDIEQMADQLIKLLIYKKCMNKLDLIHLLQAMLSLDSNTKQQFIRNYGLDQDQHLLESYAQRIMLLSSGSKQWQQQPAWLSLKSIIESVDQKDVPQILNENTIQNIEEFKHFAEHYRIFLKDHMIQELFVAVKQLGTENPISQQIMQKSTVPIFKVRLAQLSNLIAKTQPKTNYRQKLPQFQHYFIDVLFIENVDFQKLILAICLNNKQLQRQIQTQYELTNEVEWLDNLRTVLQSCIAHITKYKQEYVKQIINFIHTQPKVQKQEQQLQAEVNFKQKCSVISHTPYNLTNLMNNIPENQQEQSLQNIFKDLNTTNFEDNVRLCSYKPSVDQQQLQQMKQRMQSEISIQVQTDKYQQLQQKIDIHTANTQTSTILQQSMIQKQQEVQIINVLVILLINRKIKSIIIYNRKTQKERSCPINSVELLDQNYIVHSFIKIQKQKINDYQLRLTCYQQTFIRKIKIDPYIHNNSAILFVIQKNSTTTESLLIRNCLFSSLAFMINPKIQQILAAKSSEIIIGWLRLLCKMYDVQTNVEDQVELLNNIQISGKNQQLHSQLLIGLISLLYQRQTMKVMNRLNILGKFKFNKLTHNLICNKYPLSKSINDFYEQAFLFSIVKFTNRYSKQQIRESFIHILNCQPQTQIYALLTEAANINPALCWTFNTEIVQHVRVNRYLNVCDLFNLKISYFHVFIKQNKNNEPKIFGSLLNFINELIQIGIEKPNQNNDYYKAKQYKLQPEHIRYLFIQKTLWMKQFRFKGVHHLQLYIKIKQLLLHCPQIGMCFKQITAPYLKLREGNPNLRDLILGLMMNPLREQDMLSIADIFANQPFSSNLVKELVGILVNREGIQKYSTNYILQMIGLYCKRNRSLEKKEVLFLLDFLTQKSNQIKNTIIVATTIKQLIVIFTPHSTVLDSKMNAISEPLLAQVVGIICKLKDEDLKDQLTQHMIDEVRSVKNKQAAFDFAQMINKIIPSKEEEDEKNKIYIIKKYKNNKQQK